MAKPPGDVGKAAGVASDVDKKGAVGGCRGFLRPRAAAWWWEEEKEGSETDRQLCCLRRRPAESLSRSRQSCRVMLERRCGRTNEERPENQPGDLGHHCCDTVVLPLGFEMLVASEPTLFSVWMLACATCRSSCATSALFLRPGPLLPQSLIL